MVQLEVAKADGSAAFVDLDLGRKKVRNQVIPLRDDEVGSNNGPPLLQSCSKLCELTLKGCGATAAASGNRHRPHHG